MHNYVLAVVIAVGTSCGLVVGNWAGYTQPTYPTNQRGVQLPYSSPGLYYLFTQLLHSQKPFFSSVKPQLSLLSTAPTIETTNLFKEI